jgi:hypothetical protein
MVFPGFSSEMTAFLRGFQVDPAQWLQDTVAINALRSVSGPNNGAATQRGKAADYMVNILLIMVNDDG